MFSPSMKKSAITSGKTQYLYDIFVKTVNDVCILYSKATPFEIFDIHNEMGFIY